MAKKIHRLVPCPHYDVERIEGWLTDMAAQGVHLLKEPSMFGFLAFEKGEPQSVRYRLEPKQSMAEEDSEKPDWTAQALYEECGWEFVAAYGYFYIYRSARPDAVEMNTDPQVQSLAMKALIRHNLVPLITVLFGFCNSMSRMFSEPFRYLATFGLLYTGGFFLVMFTGISAAIFRIIHVVQLYWQLKHDIPLNHNKPWKKGAGFQRFAKVFGVVFYLLVLCVILSHCSISFSNGSAIGEYTDAPPFVTIRDLYPQAEYTLLNGDVRNTVEQSSSFLAPRYLEWHEDAEITTADGQTLRGTLDILYYETRYTWLAEGLARDFYERAKGANAFADWPTPQLDADYIVAYTSQNSGHPNVLIQNGRYFIQAYLDVFDENGEDLLEEWAAQQLERMK